MVPPQIPFSPFSYRLSFTPTLSSSPHLPSLSLSCFPLSSSGHSVSPLTLSSLPHPFGLLPSPSTSPCAVSPQSASICGATVEGLYILSLLMFNADTWAQGEGWRQRRHADFPISIHRCFSLQIFLLLFVRLFSPQCFSHLFILLSVSRSTYLSVYPSSFLPFSFKENDGVLFVLLGFVIKSSRRAIKALILQ